MFLRLVERSGMRSTALPGRGGLERTEGSPPLARDTSRCILELLSVGPVVDPFPRGGDPLAGGDRRRMADDGDEITMCPALTRSTQKPLSALWNVTRSTVPASTARSGWVEGRGARMGSIVPVRPGCGEHRARTSKR